MHDKENKNTNKSPPEYFLFNLTFPACTPVEFCNPTVHINKVWQQSMKRLKGTFELKYLVLTLTGCVYVWVSIPNKKLRSMMVECMVVCLTGTPISVLYSSKTPEMNSSTSPESI